jgi:hypothetical protein
MSTFISPMHFNSALEVATKVAKERESLIVSQLNDFISRGLIEVVVKGTQFVRSPDSANIEYRESVELVLKDKEYIENLEKENAELKSYIYEIKKLLRNEGA